MGAQHHKTSLIVHLMLLFCLSCTTALVGAESVQGEVDAFRARAEALLTPLLGREAYRLDVERNVSENGPPWRVVLVLDSRSSSVRYQNEEDLRRVLEWAGGLPAGSGAVRIAHLPFYGQEHPLARGLDDMMAPATLLAVLAVAGAAWLLRRRYRRSPRRDGTGAGASTPAGTTGEYYGEVHALRRLASEDPARVAQVLKQWINTHE